MRLLQRLALDKNQRIINSASVAARSIAVLNIQGCVDDRKRTCKRYNLFNLMAVRFRGDLWSFLKNEF